MIKATISIVFTLILAVVCGALHAAEPERLSCATRTAIQCITSTECVAGVPEAFHLPQFLHIDLAAKTVSTEEHSGTIESLESFGERIAMHGTVPESHRAWTLIYDAETRRMTVTVAGIDEGFVVFGVCSPGGG